jgi:putative tryptophan/tyrosine transport system permease protein
MLTVFLGALSMGFILAPLAMGVFISYRILRFADISVDGTYILGGAVVAVLVQAGVDPLTALIGALLAGGVAGSVTGVLITRLGIQRILAGILVMTALYGINTGILGDGPGSFQSGETLRPFSEGIARTLYGSLDEQIVFGMRFIPSYVGAVILSGAIASVFCGLLLLFFHTRLGLALRGAGSNEDAVRAMGANVPMLIITALAISNGAAALSGAMFAYEYYSVELSDGVGTIVTGLACVMLGNAFFGRSRFSLQFTAAVLGALMYRLLIAGIVQVEFFSQDHRLFTAIFVVAALVLPRWLLRLRKTDTPALKEL